MRAALFGSFARGDMDQHSDVDLLVELAPGMSLLDLSGLKVELQETLERKVDLVQDKKIRPEFAPFIYKDKKELFTQA